MSGITQMNTIVVRFNQYGAPAINGTYYLPNDPEVNAGVIRGMQVIENEIKTSFNLNGANVYLTPTQLQNCFITLCNSQGEKIYDSLVPNTFMCSKNSGELRFFLNSKIDLTKSYIYFTDVTGVSTNSYLMLNFFFTTLK